MRSEICRYVAYRPIPISPRRLATSQINGEWPSPYIGKGMDFKSHRAYQLGDDLRSVNMAMSIRAGKRMVVERVAMRDISIYILLDCSASMGIRTKAKIMKAAALMILYSGSKMEMRVGASILTDKGYHNLGLGMGNRHSLRLMDSIENICDDLSDNQLPEVDFESHNLQKMLPAGCILFYISDYMDTQGKPCPDFPFVFNSKKYDLIPVIIQDEFEYSFPELPGETLIELTDPENGESHPFWFNSSEVKKIKKINESRFSRIHEGLHDRGLSYIHASNPEIDSLHQSISNYFLYR